MGKWKWKVYNPVNPCHNKTWSARKLEAMVFGKLTAYLSNPDLVKDELQRQRQDAGRLAGFEAQLKEAERQLKVVDRDQHWLLQWALKEFPQDMVETENRRLNKAREALKAQQAGLQVQVKASQDTAVSIPKLEDFIGHMQDRIANLDFEGKRQMLDMLDITVWLDGEKVEITGLLPIGEDVIVTTPSILLSPSPSGEGA